MTKAKITQIITTAALLLIIAACGGAPKQSKCSVEIYTPEKRYTQASLVDVAGNTIDSTLVVKNDSVRFVREDVKNMPYIAKIRLANPQDSLDVLYMPMVIEGGTVKLELSNRISLSGTDDNDKMYKFLKGKNAFVAQHPAAGDLEQMKHDYSRYFSDQVLQNKDNIVGKYIYDTYYSVMMGEDAVKAKEAIEESQGKK